MKAKISSNYFFNFTHKFDYFLETLEHSAFSPRYYHEDFNYLHHSFGNISEIYILMKCFCDIPLNHLMENHIKTYGHYGIGLNKEWGLMRNLTPIHYIPTIGKDAWYPNNLASLYSSSFSKSGDSNSQDLIINYLIYTKPYEKDGTIFYNEREWRYIPLLDSIRKITKEDIRIQHHYVFPNKAANDLNFQSLKTESDKLKNNQHIKLSFDISDIKYLIVQNDDEIKKIAHLKNDNRNIKILKANDIITGKITPET